MTPPTPRPSWSKTLKALGVGVLIFAASLLPVLIPALIPPSLQRKGEVVATRSIKG